MVYKDLLTTKIVKYVAHEVSTDLMVVPLPSVSPRGSLTTAKLSESDSQTCCSSSLFLEVTITRSATKSQERQNHVKSKTEKNKKQHNIL